MIPKPITRVLGRYIPDPSLPIFQNGQNSVKLIFNIIYLEADPLEVEDSQDVFMTDEGDTPPPELLVISNGTVV